MLQPFPVNRPAVMARRHMISAGHYLAAAAGHTIMTNGGNAIDAGVAGGLVINTVLPQWTGLGGVAPIVVCRARDRRVVSISGLGWWPKAATVPVLLERGNGTLPSGVLRCVVPGAADAWLLALREFGTPTFAEVAARTRVATPTPSAGDRPLPEGSTETPPVAPKVPDRPGQVARAALRARAANPPGSVAASAVGPRLEGRGKSQDSVLGPRAPMMWTPLGRPRRPKPFGIEMPGRPARLTRPPIGPRAPRK